MKFSFLSVHPELCTEFFSHGLLGKAWKKGLIDLQSIALRDFATPPHYRVDDKPYGGGAGMVLQCEPIVKALSHLRPQGKRSRVIALSAKGRKFSQATAKRLLKYDHLIFVCGRYEGIDERVIEHYADEELSIGNYVLMGGELAALVILESVARLIPEVVGNPESLVHESCSSQMSKEYAQYTRPPVFEGHEVPSVLLGGNHKQIEQWRKARSKQGGRS